MRGEAQTEAQMLRAMQIVGQGRVAEAIGLSQSRMSALVGEGLMTRTARIVSALGFRLVAADEPVFEAEYVRSLETLVRISMDKRNEKEGV